MVHYTARLDAAFAALSDPTRRGILERLGRGDASIGELAQDFEMTLTGLKKHVGILESAGLVNKRKVGRERRGHWRFGEHSDHGAHGFEGRFREVTPKDRISMTFEWDGMPGHPVVSTAEFHDLGGGRTKVVSTMLFYTAEERDGMLTSGMEGGMNESYAALDALLARMS